MKKSLVLILALLMLFTGCSTKEAVAPQTTETPADTKVETPEEFYNAYTEAEKRPVAVMIDNDGSAAWPHAGLSEAYLLYEMHVEGNATRIMAFFNNTDTAKIGPVRSSRHYFLDYAMEHDAIYVHYGYSPKAMEDIPALGVNNINGVEGADANTFWREEKYKGDYHSAFTSMELINKQIAAHKYRTEREKAPLKFNTKAQDIDGKSAKKVAYQYAGFYRAGFEYDEESGTYKRYMNGADHKLQEGTGWKVKNIILMHVKNYPLGDGSERQQLDTVGSGKGYYVTQGKYIPVTWEKPSRTAATVYKNEKGEEITLNPGQTWIMIIPGNGTPVIE